MSGQDFLPYGRHGLDDADMAAVAGVLRGDWLTSGPMVETFERRLEEITGGAHAVACNSGTAALHLAALALGLGPGDTVVVPAITFVATANAARFVGADVVFADVDPTTGLVTPESVERAVRAAGDSVKAVFPVHLAGQAVDLEGIGAFVRPRGIVVVEDACHALGTQLDSPDRRIGGCTHSEATCFSFHAVKTVAMGEGGAVLTNDPARAARMRGLRSHGIVRDADDFVFADQARDVNGEINPWYYEMAELGFNFRAPDILCALGLSQLSKLESFVARRAQLTALYDAALAPLGGKVAPLSRPSGCRPAWHLYVVRIPFAELGFTRGGVMRALKTLGIGTQVHYIPVYRQPYYAKTGRYTALPGAEAYYDTCLSLPLFPGMQDSDVERVSEALAMVLDGKLGPIVKS